MTPIKSVLVTGGAGFIGTHLCRALASSGTRVKVIDIQDPKERVPQVDYTKANILDPAALSRAMENVQAVYHLAAIVSIPVCQENPIESYQTNLVGTCR